VGLEGELEVFPFHAAAVVAYFHEPRPAFLDGKFDGEAACVYRVIDEFAGKGCGAVDDFAGGDLPRFFGR
jgi:hypothetical protein